MKLDYEPLELAEKLELPTEPTASSLTTLLQKAQTALANNIKQKDQLQRNLKSLTEYLENQPLLKQQQIIQQQQQQQQQQVKKEVTSSSTSLSSRTSSVSQEVEDVVMTEAVKEEDDTVTAEVKERKRKRNRDPDGEYEDKTTIITRQGDDCSIKLAISTSGMIKITKSGKSPPLLPASTSSVVAAVADDVQFTKGSTPKVKNITKNRKSDTNRDSTPQSTPQSFFSSSIMQDLLPSSEVIASGDYSKVKIPPQVPLMNFLSFSDQFFKPLTDDDLEWLEREDDNVTPFIIPKQGLHYKEQWARDDGTSIPKEANSSQSTPGITTLKIPTGKPYAEIDGTLYSGDVFFGTLSERILASLINKKIDFKINQDDDTEIEDKKLNGGVVDYTRDDMMALEDRIRNELKYLGLIPEDDFAPTTKSAKPNETEIFLELTKTQNQLRAQLSTNKFRKSRLLETARYWIAWQQYENLLDEYNKQIQNVYVKRYRPKKSKKKSTTTEITQSKALPSIESILELIGKRDKLVKELGGMFNAEKFTMPKQGETIFDANVAPIKLI